MELSQRKNLRLQGYDYSLPGFYYVTICTYQRECYFGEIKENMMLLSNIGKLVNDEWEKIPQKYNQIKLDFFQVMPSHFHGVIQIVGAGFPGPKNLSQIIAYFKYQTTKQINELGLVPVWFKIKKNNESGAETAPLQRERIIRKIWQRNFYEHIIRNDNELFAIRQYIKLNPQNWAKDENNPEVNL